jgi:protein TonB
MIAAAADIAELRRWVACAAVVVGFHAAAVLMLTRFPDPSVATEETSGVIVDLAPFAGAPGEVQQDLPPGPPQEMTEPQPPQPEKLDEKPVEKKVEEKPVDDKPPEEKVETPPDLPPTPPVEKPEVVMPAPQKPVTRAKPKSKPPTPQVATAPRPQVRSPDPTLARLWHGKIAAQIQRHASAEAGAGAGVVQLAFSLDRQGRVMASHVAKSSGMATLDRLAIATLQRSQPFPPPPADLPGAKFDFTIPIHYH